MTLPSTWETIELPVLEAVITKLEVNKPGQAIQTRDIESLVDLDSETVLRAVARLRHEHLIVETIDYLAGPSDYIIHEPTPKGLRAAGVWPSKDAAAQAFIRALDSQIEESPEGSSKKSALESIRESAKRITEGTLTTLVTAAVKGAAGM